MAANYGSHLGKNHSKTGLFCPIFEWFEHLKTRPFYSKENIFFYNETV
jgi:hypothetical protein